VNSVVYSLEEVVEVVNDDDVEVELSTPYCGHKLFIEYIDDYLTIKWFIRQTVQDQ
jgi:hypothetical protein